MRTSSHPSSNAGWPKTTSLSILGSRGRGAQGCHRRHVCPNRFENLHDCRSLPSLGRAEAYESDLPWLHYGQSVRFTSEAFPGETFTGQIAFIDPVLDARTRMVRMRVNLANTQSKLKPDMFVRAVVRSRIAKGGQVMDPGLAGKWISPMHPEIIKDEPGTCDICGMDLVSAQSLGYAEATQDTAPLVIPASAPLITGKRAVVYLDKGNGIYEGRDITLGPRAGDHYLVERGLKEGDRVVTG